MFGRLMPREGRFFTYFDEHAAQIVLGARELRALMDNVAQLPERKRSRARRSRPRPCRAMPATTSTRGRTASVAITWMARADANPCRLDSARVR
jgi:hypothetical protein